MSGRGNTCWKIENSFSFWSEKKGEGIDYDWGGSIERGGGGGEKKAQRGGWRVSKGERKKLTDATCLKGEVWGRSRRGLSRCVESSWVVGNNKFYARLSLSFSTFKFNIWIILNWHFSILLFSLSFFYCTEFPRIIRIVESSVVSSQMLKNRKSVVVATSTFIRNFRKQHASKEKWECEV